MKNLLILSAISCMVLSGCTNGTIKKKEAVVQQDSSATVEVTIDQSTADQSSSSDSSESSLPTNNIDWEGENKPKQSDSMIYTIKDSDTGCQYIVVKYGNSGTIQPRLLPSGLPKCS